MSKEKTTALYICSTICVMVIIALIVKLYKNNDARKLPIISRGNIILIDTPEGVIRLDSSTVAQELYYIAEDIRAHSTEIEDDSDFKNSLHRVMSSLNDFIHKNTFSKAYSNSELLTSSKMSQLELNLQAAYGGHLESNLLNTSLFNVDGDNDQEILYFLDNDAMNTAKKIGIVADNIDIVLRLIRENTTFSGKIDLTSLYKLQNELRRRIGCRLSECKCKKNHKSSIPVLQGATFRESPQVMAEIMNRSTEIGINPSPIIISAPVVSIAPGNHIDEKYGTTTLNPELNKQIEGFSDQPTNIEVQKKLDIVSDKDLYTTNPVTDIELGGTWEKFLRAHPQGIINRYGDIDVKDLLGYRLNGSFQASLYEYDDQYRMKMSRCLQNKYRNLEDETIFDRCMNWY
jgi:hypothetical protein